MYVNVSANARQTQVHSHDIVAATIRHGGKTVLVVAIYNPNIEQHVLDRETAIEAKLNQVRELVDKTKREMASPIVDGKPSERERHSLTYPLSSH